MDHRLWLLLALAACNGDKTGTDTGGTDVTDADTDADSDADADADADTDADSDADADADTDADTDTATTPPLADLLTLLTPIPAGTAWDQVDPAVQDALQEHAQLVWDDYAARWGAAAVGALEPVVLADAGAIHDNVDTYARGQLPVASTFSVDDVADAGLRDALRRLYIAHVGLARNTLVYNGVLSLDVDGVTPLVEPPMPDPESEPFLLDYADDVAVELEALAASGALSADDAALATSASYVARSLRTGSFALLGFGGDELHNPWGLEVWAAEPVFDYPLLGAWPTSEEYLRALNAEYLSEDVKYLSANTLSASVDFVWPGAMGGDGLFDYFLYGDPEAIKDSQLLHAWFEDRLAARPEAASPCYAFDAADQERVVDSFTADLLLPSSPTYLTDFQADLQVRAPGLTAEYQDAAIAGLDALFADDVLPTDQRAAVVAAIQAETAFGAVVATTEAALTAQTGTSDLADQFQAAIDAVPVLGGTYTVDPADEAAVQLVWTDVRAGLVERFEGPTRTISVDATLPTSVLVDTSFGIFTAQDGTITVGLGLPQSEALMYVILSHEALHSLDGAAGLHPTGSAIEGAASMVEHTVGHPILAEFAPVDRAPFWTLAVVSGDTRRYGITDATLAVLTTDCSGGVDSVDLAVEAAAAWGIAGAGLYEVPARSHWGTQFLSYLAGQFVYEDLVAYFEDQIDPGVDNGLTPFDLHTCGDPTPAMSPEVAASIATCLGL